ncbi:unnamed protein product, partial [Brassica rapa subsp. trilocularis]
FSHKYPTNLFSYVVVNLLLYCYKCLFDSEACNFKNQDQQQIHVGRLSTKGGNDATRLRFIDPLWKLKWFLNIGSQARLKKSIATIDKFVYRLIITKRKEQNTVKDILSRFLVEREKDPERMNDKYLRDIILSFDRWEGHNRCISLLVLVHALQKPTCSGENNAVSPCGLV